MKILNSCFYFSEICKLHENMKKKSPFAIHVLAIWWKTVQSRNKISTGYTIFQKKKKNKKTKKKTTQSFKVIAYPWLLPIKWKLYIKKVFLLWLDLPRQCAVGCFGVSRLLTFRISQIMEYRKDQSKSMSSFSIISFKEIIFINYCVDCIKNQINHT